MNVATIAARIQTLHTMLETARVTFYEYGAPVAGLTDLPCRYEPNLDPVPDAALQVEARLTLRTDVLTTAYPTASMEASVTGPDGRTTRYAVLRTPVVDPFNAVLPVEVRKV